MKRKIENVAIVQFPLNGVGGIVTWNREIQKGFNRLGINTMLFHAVPANKFLTDPEKEIEKERFTQLPGYHLNYNDNGIDESLQILNSFDVVIFSKGSPHPTKDNLSKKGIENWPLLYHKVKVPKVMIFHDANWEKTNPWLDEVKDSIDICIAAQKKFNDSVDSYPARCDKYWDCFPMDFETINKLNLKQKQFYGILATQWIKWKNHYKLIPKLANIKVPMRLFGNGIEWYYIRKTKEYQEAINFDTRQKKILNPEAIHNFLAHVNYAELQNHYAGALFSIDLSTRGYTNYTHFEPLAYRTISMIERNVFQDEDNIIPEDCCMIYDIETVEDKLNWFASNRFNQTAIDKILDNGQKFIQRFDCTKIAQNIINHINDL